MSKSPDQYKTYIQFIKPYYVHEPNFHNQTKKSVDNLKSVHVKVPERFSDSGFCYLLIPEQFILDMKPSKEAKRISWVELVFKTYKESDFGDLIPNSVKVRIKKNDSFDTIILPVEELRLLHLEAMHKLPKKKRMV